jgi:hypothetical protein
MAGIFSDQRIILIEAGASVGVETYGTRLELVKALINSGTLGVSGSYGDTAHLYALEEVKKQLCDTAAKIARQNQADAEHRNIWDSTGVKEALADGRPPDDIRLLRCPECQRWGFWNEGSHFSCEYCLKTWLCFNQDEKPDADMPWIRCDEVVTLADYENEPH